MTDESKRKLRSVFFDAVGRMATDLEEFATATPPVANAFAEKARSVAHRLHGSGQLYGFSGITQLGERLEAVFTRVAEGELAADERVAKIAKSCAEMLRKLPEYTDNSVHTACENLIWECDCVLHENDHAV